MSTHQPKLIIFIWFSFVILFVLLASLILSLGVILSKFNFLNREFSSPLECGFSTKELFRQPVSLRFFIFAVIFVVFDIELILVIPYLTRGVRAIKVRTLFICAVFLLAIGLFLEWNNKAFDWLMFVRSS